MTNLSSAKGINTDWTYDPSVGVKCPPSLLTSGWQNQDNIIGELSELHSKVDKLEKELELLTAKTQKRQISHDEAYTEVARYFQEQYDCGKTKFTIPDVAKKFNLPLEQVDDIVEKLLERGFIG